MRSRSAPDVDTVRWFRTGTAAILSIALHGSIAYAVLDTASNVYGLANVDSPSKSVESVQTIVLEAIAPTEDIEPPAASQAVQASLAAAQPTPDQHVPETQLEKTEPSQAIPPSASSAPVPPPIEMATLQPPPPQPPAAQEATPEPPTPASPAITVDRPDAVEIAVQAPDPTAKIEEERRAEAKRRAEQEAQRRVEEAAREKAKQHAEAQRREQERKKAEQAAAAKRHTEEAEKKKKAAQQAKQRQQAKGAERDQRASAASTGKTSQKQNSGRTTASRGDVVTYGAMVRARVAANQPSGVGAGSVVVSFGVSPSGGLAQSRIWQSSGNGSVDQAALSAVRRASPFPQPPDARQHSFSIKFNFR